MSLLLIRWHHQRRYKNMSGGQLAHEIGGIKQPLNFQISLGTINWPGPTLIGVIPQSFVTSLIVVDVQSAFDGSASLTIGDSSGHGNLVTIADVFLDQPYKYEIPSTHAYNAVTQVYAYLTGSPTTGSLNITLFYQ